MNLSEPVKRFLWGILLTIGPYIAGCFVYVGIAMALQLNGTDMHMFAVAAVLAAAYRALEGDWVTSIPSPHSAADIAQVVAIALFAGLITCFLHTLWIVPIFEWLELPLEYAGIPTGLAGGATLTMSGRNDLAYRRYMRMRAEREKKDSD